MSSGPFESHPVDGSSIRAWLELVRLPNLATAWADVLMGFLVTHESFAPWKVLALLIASSTALYSAGMVLNDVFDAQVDREDRPARPIPSGRIDWQSALAAGITLLPLGAILAWVAAWLVGDWRPGCIGTLLAVCVWLYDGVLKQTPVAPLAMGSCRFLNVLLGMSAATAFQHPMYGMIAAGIGVYVAGITWYARTEAQTSRRGQLVFGMLVMAAGLGLLAWFPAWEDAELMLPRNTTPERWLLLIAMIGVLIGYRAAWGVIEASPIRVQMAVKQAILSLIILDASVCFVFRGFEGALPILVLVIPALGLGRWFSST